MSGPRPEVGLSIAIPRARQACPSHIGHAASSVIALSLSQIRPRYLTFSAFPAQNVFRISVLRNGVDSSNKNKGGSQAKGPIWLPRGSSAWKQGIPFSTHQSTCGGLPAARSVTLNRSLSAILPFRNAEHVVLDLIPRYVDVFSELSNEWEIVAIDDGSTDATPEILAEFAQLYPQVRVAAHGQARGFYATLCTALSLSVGNTLFLPLRYQPMTLDALHRLWLASRDHPLVIGLPSDEYGEDDIECLMLQRRVASPILPALSSPERLAAVVGRFQSQAVIVPLRRHDRLIQERGFHGSRGSFAVADGREVMPRSPKSLAVRAAKTVFSRIKQFALDE